MLGFFPERRVNVLRLNLAMDELTKTKKVRRYAYRDGQ